MNVELNAILSREAVRTLGQESIRDNNMKHIIDDIMPYNQITINKIKHLTWEPEDKSTVQYFPGVRVCNVA